MALRRLRQKGTKISRGAAAEDHLALWLHLSSDSAPDPLDELELCSAARSPRADLPDCLAPPAKEHTIAVTSPDPHDHWPHASYRILVDGVSIAVRSLLGDTDSAGALITINGTTCLRRGGIRAAQDAIEFLRELGVSIDAITVRRIDLAIDLPGASMEQFVDLYEEGQFSARGRNGRENSRAGTTLRFGAPGRCQLQLYDKLAQLRQRSDERTRQLMIERRWGGEKPECATRAEFRLRAAYLHSWHIHTFDQYLDHRHDLIAYLTGSWFRFLTRPAPSNQKSRVPTHPLWRRTQKIATRSLGAGDVMGPTDLTAPPPDTAHLRRTVVGMLIHLAAAESRDLSDLSDMADFAAELISAGHGHEQLACLVAKKKQELRAKGRIE